VASLVIEHIERPATARERRAVGAAQDRVADVLAGCTVWCAAALPSSARAVRQLRTCLDGAGPGTSAPQLEVDVDEEFSGLAKDIQLMLGAASGGRVFGAAERALFAQASADGDELLPDAVGPGDVVVAHDAPSVAVARVARERGAHAVWRVRVSRPTGATPHQALEFLPSFTTGVDAYVLSWLERGGRGDVIERIAAAMPATDMVALKETAEPARGDELHRLAWRMAYAEIVRSDREEGVGGTLRPRPAVAAR